MHIHRGTVLLAAAATLLVPVSALPAGAAVPVAAGVPAVGAGVDDAGCTAARAAQDAYRDAELVPLLEAQEARVSEVEDLVAQGETDLAAATVVLAEADAAHGVAQDALTAAVAALEAAEQDGDAEAIAEARAAYDLAHAGEIAAMGPVSAAEGVFYAAREGLELLRVERDETLARLVVLQDAVLGRGIDNEQQLQDYVGLLRLGGLDEYADLVVDLADACFVYVDPDAGEDDVVVPAAPVAAPVPARATFTG